MKKLAYILFLVIFLSIGQTVSAVSCDQCTPNCLTTNPGTDQASNIARQKCEQSCLGSCGKPAESPTAPQVGTPYDPSTISFSANVPIGKFKDCTFSGSATGGNNCLGIYIQAWYGFALGTLGILATFMIMFAGFKYLTSRGDTKAISEAKTLIVSAVSGLILAFLIYTILNIINPNLLIIKMPAIPSIKTTGGMDLGSQSVSSQAPGSGGAGATKSGTAQALDPGVAAACGQSTTLNYENMSIPEKNPQADFSQPSNGKTENYWFDYYGNQYKVDPNLLRAIAAAESGGNANIQMSPAGACGLMQILPATASAVTDNNVSCEELSANASLSIEIAAQYLSQNKLDNKYNWIAGYNGGYSTSKAGAALSASKDCPGTVAYRCCTNPGGLTQTQNYVYRVSEYQQYYANHPTQ